MSWNVCIFSRSKVMVIYIKIYIFDFSVTLAKITPQLSEAPHIYIYIYIYISRAWVRRSLSVQSLKIKISKILPKIARNVDLSPFEPGEYESKLDFIQLLPFRIKKFHWKKLLLKFSWFFVIFCQKFSFNFFRWNFLARKCNNGMK